MRERGGHAVINEISFRSLVKDCAEEPQLIASFNRICGAQLQAPIGALLDDRWPQGLSETEELQLGCFILFIHETLWRRLKHAQARLRTALEALKREEAVR